jgi:hypothetical protein
LGRSTSEPTPKVKISWLGRSSPSSFIAVFSISSQAVWTLVEHQVDGSLYVAQRIEAGKHLPIIIASLL